MHFSGIFGAVPVTLAFLTQKRLSANSECVTYTSNNRYILILPLIKH